MSEIRWDAKSLANAVRCSKLDDVTLRFGGVTALQDVTFDVNDNELFAIIGPNGAGKTSIFNCLNGVYHPQRERFGSRARTSSACVRGPPRTWASRGRSRTSGCSST